MKLQNTQACDTWLLFNLLFNEAYAFHSKHPYNNIVELYNSSITHTHIYM